MPFWPLIKLPRVSPGKYKVWLTIDGQTLTQEFSVLMDPRVESGGTTLEDIRAQEKLNLAITDLLSKSKKMAAKIQETRKALREKAESNGLSETERSLDRKYQSLEEKLVTAQGRYPQPMLIDQIKYLFSLLNRTNQAPGKDAIERFEELKEQFEALPAKDFK